MAIKEQKTETAPLTWTEFETLLSKLTYAVQVGGETSLYRFLVFAAVATFCGLRAGDVLRLKWSDLLNKTSILVKEGKTGKVREIALNQKLQEILQLSHHLASPTSTDHFIVPSTSSAGLKPMSLQYMNRWVKIVFDRFGVAAQNASTHAFRKTFGRRVYDMNHRSEDALITLSHIFNHSSVSITRGYIGLKREKIADVYMAI